MRKQQDEHSEREEQLKNQVSSLTKDLRVVKDKLALAEQKIKELVTSFEDNKADSSGLQTQLQESEAKMGALKSSLASMSNELDIAREQYRQQSREMKEMSGRDNYVHVQYVRDNTIVIQLKIFARQILHPAQLPLQYIKFNKISSKDCCTGSM